MAQMPVSRRARGYVRLRRAARRRHHLALNAVVFVGGALGAALRLALFDLLPYEPGRVPWATFAANIAGSFLLGLVAVRLVERPRPSGYRGPLLATGLCGALTTFSALQVEVLQLGRGGHAGLAAGYLAASILCGLAAVAFASGLARRSGTASVS
jgi:fluoride exporter